MMQHVMFALKVAAVILVINQIPPIKEIINKQYFGSM